MYVHQVPCIFHEVLPLYIDNLQQNNLPSSILQFLGLLQNYAHEVFLMIFHRLIETRKKNQFPCLTES